MPFRKLIPSFTLTVLKLIPSFKMEETIGMSLFEIILDSKPYLKTDENDLNAEFTILCFYFLT